LRDALLSGRRDGGAQRYQLRQRQARSGRTEQLWFDESGIPIERRNPGVLRRVARLFKPL
jgi:hypothetical protein